MSASIPSSAGGKSNYQRQQQGSKKSVGKLQANFNKPKEKSENTEKKKHEGNLIDSIFGFERYKKGETRVGWLLNYLQSSCMEDGIEKSAMDLYFIDRQGENFKATVIYEPYFYIDVSSHSCLQELSLHLQKHFESCRVEFVDLEDLDMPNHLSGKRHTFLKILFDTVSELQECKQELRNHIQQAEKLRGWGGEGGDVLEAGRGGRAAAGTSEPASPLRYVTDLREHDVGYSMRCGIDLSLRIGAWFSVTPHEASEACTVVWEKDILELGTPRILAFDIECEKSPLKFPNPDVDRIFMISYMVDGQGFLIVNREIVSADIEDFEYTPKAKYPGPFSIFNVANEKDLLNKFITHLQELRPHVVVTYNGDFFDWPYVDTRCNKYQMNLYHTLGIRGTAKTAEISNEGEYLGRCMVHLDAFCWVKRDSYLPQGQQGLKAVTRNKLGYDPAEVDPEDMLRFARERPHHMASYSVSDAVATFYLYTTYVHNFIFSLSTIIPMGPEDVLRKGSGTLCEALLMVEAFNGQIVCPNKQVDKLESFYEGHLLESETYIGGHVECLEAGIFRSDILNKFTLVPTALQMLIDHVDRDLTFALEVENGVQRSEIENYDEIKQEIVAGLEMLRDSPVREEFPMILHLDVGAMYPNIILTNRLQPSAIVSQKDCAACDFNRAENNCKRNMSWKWRGDFSPANLGDYNAVKRQLAFEKFESTDQFSDKKVKMFSELTDKEQAKEVSKRLKIYSQSHYRKSKVTKTEERVDTVCMRENGFYVDTVRAFRDRRYDYKLLTKQWKGKLSAAEKSGDALAKRDAESKIALMDSLQIAHKCILNSFYGYVMRKGARWRSMEMAGIVTHNGADLIKQARILVEQIGRPLELDTDGIWCILPSSFPQNFKFKMKNGGGSVKLEYPCAMLNADVHNRNTNHQYQDLVAGHDGTKGHGLPKYATHSECSIYFELDGPYKAMVLPASPEEGKLLKKKYVVFNHDNSIAELKGFELKRRGELELVKAFQQQVFSQFLEGDTLETAFAAVGRVANLWLDVLDSKGVDMDDDELLELISERKTISKTLEDYEGRKATSLTTASRLADFLGAEMVKDKGLNCNLIISRLPAGAPVTERAIPVTIFSAEPHVKVHYLRKWLKNHSLECEDFREVVDWDYYKDRLARSVQKIITIPAGMQGVLNPCPRVEHPVWVKRLLHDKFSSVKQMSIKAMFGAAAAPRKLLKSTPVGGAGIVSESDPKKRVLEEEVGMETTASAAPALLDMEDTVSRSSSGVGVSGRPLVVQSTARKLPSSPSSPTQQQPVRGISLDEVQTKQELNSWLQARKSLWRGYRQDKHGVQAHVSAEQRVFGRTTSDVLSGLRGNGVQDDLNAPKRPMGINDLVRSAARAAVHGSWQIVEIQETDVPGSFVVWAFTSSSQLQRLYISIPRTLYANCHDTTSKSVQMITEMGGKLVKKVLPHDRPTLNLYEIDIPEHKYIRDEKAVDFILSDPRVEGVYETKTPLLFRAVTKLGCMASVSNPNAITRDGGSPSSAFMLKELHALHIGLNASYLEPKSAIFRRIFIYSSFDKGRDGSRGVVGVFVLEGTNKVTEAEEGETGVFTAKAFVWLVQPGGQVDRPPMNKIFRRFCPNQSSTCKFTTLLVRSAADAFSRCNDVLSGYIRERKGPTIVIAQGTKDSRSWRKSVNLLQQFPLILMPSSTNDEMFPTLHWQVRICNIMIQRFLVLPQWFDDRLCSARYAHVPVGNLGRDADMTMTDVLFARQLIHNRHLLWAAPGSLPDLGGAEQDRHNVWSDSLVEPIISVPGAYRNICVELEIFGLAVQAIMASGLLDAQGLTTISASTQSEFAGDTSAAAGASSLSNDASCARAFALLKAEVTKWSHEFINTENLHAEVLLMGLYRYLCGRGQTLLHDPALHRIVYALMIKLFGRLIAEFKKLGSVVVYADFYRIIISTNRHDYAAVTEYIDFIVAAVMADLNMFQFIQIHVKGLWEQLLWLDSENWSAVPLDVAANQDQDQDQDQEDAEEGHELVDMTTDVDALDEQGETDEDAPMKEANMTEDVSGVIPAARGDRNEKFVTFSQKDSKQESETESAWDERQKEDEYDFLNFSGDESSEDEKEDESAYRYEDVYDGYDDEDDDYYEHKLEGKPTVLAHSEGIHVAGHWDLVAFLPKAAGIYLRHAIDQYLLVFQEQWLVQVGFQKQALLECGEGGESYADMSDGGSGGPVLTSANYQVCVEEVNEYMKELVRLRLGPQLLKIVDVLIRRYPGGALASHDLTSSVLKNNVTLGSNHVALQFVKYICKILSLDVVLANEVAGLRRTLLTQLNVKEFNASSEYEDPSVSYILRDVICSHCNTCKDVDLLRDPLLSGKAMLDEEYLRSSSAGALDPHSDDAEETILATPKWQCSHCGSAYDVYEVEQRLLEDAERLCASFLLQDFRCSRTSAVSTRYCTSQSDFCAPLIMDFDPAALRSRLQTLQRVADFHEFEWLSESLKELGV